MKATLLKLRGCLTCWVLEYYVSYELINETPGSLTSFIRWMNQASQCGSICKLSLDLSCDMTRLAVFWRCLSSDLKFPCIARLQKCKSAVSTILPLGRASPLFYSGFLLDDILWSARRQPKVKRINVISLFL